MSRKVETVAIDLRGLPKCQRCGEKWCGTGLQILKVNLHPMEDRHLRFVTYGSKKCREKGPKRS